MDTPNERRYKRVKQTNANSARTQRNANANQWSSTQWPQHSAQLANDSSPVDYRHKYLNFMAREFETMVNNKEFSDITLTVNGVIYYAHKNILASRSPVFAAMFRSNMSESQTNNVVIDDCDCNVFEVFLNYLYTSDVSKLKQFACELFAIADKYQVMALKTYCENSIEIENKMLGLSKLQIDKMSGGDSSLSGKFRVIYELNLDEYSYQNLFDLESRITTITTVYKQSSIQMSRMTNDFRELSALGSGGFGTVFKCQCKADNNLYAIKKVCFNSEERETVDKELDILSQLDSKYVVKFIDSWVENNYYIGSYIGKREYGRNKTSDNLLYSPKSPLLLHIQMQLCSLTLRDVIKIIMKDCLTGEDKTLSLIGYYVSYELLNEVLECVQHLHQRNPAIIHRDLKPENILINYSSDNRFIKLADFGLSAFQSFADQSHITAIANYRALEVNRTSKYTTKADLYSLGVIFQDLFNLDFGDGNTQKIKYLTIIEQRMEKIINLTETLHSLSPSKRPNLDEVLNYFELLRLTDNEIKKDNRFMQIVNNSSNSYSIDNQFIEFFVHNKYKFSAKPLINEFEHKKKKRKITTETIVKNEDLIANNSGIGFVCNECDQTFKDVY